MSENSVRVPRKMSARLLKSSSVNTGRCGTPDSPGSKTSCASPGPANIGGSSPTSTKSSSAILATSNIGPPSNAHNYSGHPIQRAYFPRGGRFGGGGGYGHHSGYSYHSGMPYHQKPGSPPFSKSLLDFMMRQWQTFETIYSQRTGQPTPVDNGSYVSSPPRQLPPHHSNSSPHRHNQRVGATYVGSRRFSDNGHHHQVSQNLEDYPPPTSASQQLPATQGDQHHNTGSLRRNRQAQFSQNEHLWQRRQTLGRKNSPSNSNRPTGGHQRLPVNAPAVSSLETQPVTDHCNGPTGDQSTSTRKLRTTVGESSPPAPITSVMQTLSLNNQSHPSAEPKTGKNNHSIDALSTGGEQYFTPDPSSSPTNAVTVTSLVNHHLHPTSSSSSPPANFFQSDSPSPFIATSIAPPLVSAINR